MNCESHNGRLYQEKEINQYLCSFSVRRLISWLFRNKNALGHHLRPKFSKFNILFHFVVGLKLVKLVSLHLRFEVIQVFEAINGSCVAEIR